MSWDPPDLEESRVRRVWLVSPAVATVLFFIAQAILASSGDGSSSVRAAAPDTPSAIPVKIRVVAQIKSAAEVKAARVPESESELLELFKKQGAVVFSSSEVEDIGTQASEFETTEVGVITAGK